MQNNPYMTPPPYSPNNAGDYHQMPQQVPTFIPPPPPPPQHQPQMQYMMNPGPGHNGGYVPPPPPPPPGYNPHMPPPGYNPHHQQQMPPHRPVSPNAVAYDPNSQAHSSFPVVMRCPACGHEGLTRVNLEAGAAVWGISIGCCLLGLFAGCCLIPFCIDSLKDATHFCQACHRQIAHRRPC